MVVILGPPLGSGCAGGAQQRCHIRVGREESWNNGMAWVGKDHKDHFIPPSTTRGCSRDGTEPGMGSSGFPGEVGGCSALPWGSSALGGALRRNSGGSEGLGRVWTLLEEGKRGAEVVLGSPRRTRWSRGLGAAAWSVHEELVVLKALQIRAELCAKENSLGAVEVPQPGDRNEKLPSGSFFRGWRGGRVLHSLSKW